MAIQSDRFPSTWHLSSARAVAGVMYLIDNAHVSPERLSAAGFGSTRPLVPETSDEARRRNRRLEFVFYPKEGAEPAPLGELGLLENGLREADLPALEH